ncbi:MAG TPA: hypothetical protein VJP90_08800 [Paenarthrobacter sp.]|nr:hypothetical protein [Paenarthrobacter sp.]
MTYSSPGDDVFLVMDGAELSSGVVDAVTEDGEMLWLHLGGGAGRRLYIRSEGEDVWRVDAAGSV